MLEDGAGQAAGGTGDRAGAGRPAGAGVSRRALLRAGALGGGTVAALAAGGAAASAALAAPAAAAGHAAAASGSGLAGAAAEAAATAATHPAFSLFSQEDLNFETLFTLGSAATARPRSARS